MNKIKVFFTVDIHGNEKYLNIALKRAAKSDLVVLAGDFTFFEENMKKILQEFDALQKPVLVIHGNHEDEKELQRVVKKFKYVKYVHKQFYEYHNLIFYFNADGGFGDIDPGIDRDILKVKKRFDEFKKKHKNAKTIIVFHSPPADTNLDIVNYGDHEESVGSLSKREMIYEIQPELMIAGHIHDCSYRKDKLGNTFLLNPGPKGRVLKFKF